MKFELGRCLLSERLAESGVTLDDLSRTLQYKPERLCDFMDNKRIMPLKVAISIADTLRCNVTQLYELHPSG
ncbi:helix-turn-helix domain-containing protein [Cohnella kolymensis]|uniref:helix-turn-helix domain-containing protein n=1 Tax=Cohnella kolymensis TaxID=1590652 RepID=UPI0009E5D390|nr:helix-turn-helix domain-containing protein [Cohnella kolymensis]